MVTKQQFLTAVRDIVDEPSAAQWSDDQLTRWLSEGNRDLARVTHNYTSKATLTMIAGTAEYTLDASILTVMHAYYNDGTQSHPLDPKQYENMDQVWGNNKDMQGSYPNYYTTWGYSPNMVIRFYPVPSVNGKTVDLLTTVIPLDLPVAPSATVDVPTAWWDALADYCEWKALRKARDPRWQEARDEYMRKRDEFVVNGDSLPVNREVVPDPRTRYGYVDRWLADPYYDSF